MIIRFEPQGVCPKQFILDIDDETHKIKKFYHMGGCQGNLDALGNIMEGMDALEFAKKVIETKCGNKDTSCMGELAKKIIEKLGD